MPRARFAPSFRSFDATFGLFIVHHSPAKALHGAKVHHRHRLRGQHAFDFVGWLERPQGRDRGEHLLIASFVCLAPEGNQPVRAIALISTPLNLSLRDPPNARSSSVSGSPMRMSRAGAFFFVNTAGAIAPPLRFICGPVLRRVCPMG